MTLLVKICGLRTAEALDAALEAGADMVGFVFFAPSPRHLHLDVARALGARVNGRARKVALSVDAGDDDLGAIVDALKPDLLQLHGKETPERVACGPTPDVRALRPADRFRRPTLRPAHRLRRRGACRG